MRIQSLKKAKVKIGFLISYDCQYIFNALPAIYDYADEIILAVDRNRLTWAGNRYDFDESFFDQIKNFDSAGKITVFEDDFYIASLSPIENETRERNMISEKMGPDCWKLQIDVDEYFVDFKTVYDFLQQHRYLLSKPNYNAVNIRGKWVTLFKKTTKGYLYVDNDEDFSFATNVVGQHFFGRDLASKTNREIYAGFEVVHQSWARDPEEIYQKINNWGHKNDFDTEAYFQFWMRVDETNYTQFTNLHPVYPEDWKCLKFIECSNIDEFREKYRAAKPAPLEVKLPKRYYKKYVKNTLKFWRR